jgi:hypothetical protein
MTSRIPDSATHPLHRLPESGRVALSELSGAELWFVRALRSRVATCAAARGSRPESAASSHGLGEAEPALERFVEATCAGGTSPACAPVAADGLSTFEAHVMHAVACLQSGLLGEAWKTLAHVCSSGVAGRALLPLEEVAAALARTGRRLGRWHLEDGPPGHLAWS